MYTPVYSTYKRVYIYAALREKEASPRMAAVTKRLREGWRGVREVPLLHRRDEAP